MSDPKRLRLPTPTLCLVTDLGIVGNDVAQLVGAVSSTVDNGVNVVQVRAPEASAGEFDALVEGVVEAVGNKALAIVNPSSRPIELFQGVAGLQLSESAEASIEDARRMYGAGSLVGRSVHSVDGARRAKETGADFLVLGTIFPSGSHPGGAAHGVGIIRRVVRETGLPVIGIGGITTENVGEVLRSGAVGVAVVRSILGAADPGAATRELMAAMLDASSG